MGALSTIPIRRFDTMTPKAVDEELNSYLNDAANDFAVDIRQDLRKKWDRIIIITGKRGVGKSTLSLILNKLIDYTFAFDRLAFSPEEMHPILNRMIELGPFHSMQMDEGGEIWNRQDWATRISKALSKQFIGDRWMYSCRTVLAPTIFHLDSKAIDMADYWIRVYSPNNRDRGYAEVRLMTEKDFYDKKLPFAPPFMDIRFDPLEDWVGDAYESYKISKGKERSQKYSDIITNELAPKKEMLDLEEVAKEVVTRLDNYLDTTGKCSWRKIYGAYSSKGIGQIRAKTIAEKINDAREHGFKP
jgi:energy-coupling factor transporter ATP-binding protein EcfA2